MIAAIETHIAAQHAHVKVGTTAVVYYGPDADRPKGETKYPCYVLRRLFSPAPDLARAVPHHEVFEPSTETQTIELPDYYGGGSVEGPASWTVRPAPTPITLDYQFEAQATIRSQANGLFLMHLEALPMPYRVEIEGCWVRIQPHPHRPVIIEEEDAGKPVFRMIQRYEVSNVWIDRLTSYEVLSIAGVDPEFGTE